MAFTNNFSPSFRWCDSIFGTDAKCREFRARVNETKEAMKKSTKEQRVAMEQKRTEEVDAEGLETEAEAEVRGIIGVSPDSKAKVQ